MEVLSVQNQYPAHFALATGKYSISLKKTYTHTCTHIQTKK